MRFGFNADANTVVTDTSPTRSGAAREDLPALNASILGAIQIVSESSDPARSVAEECGMWYWRMLRILKPGDKLGFELVELLPGQQAAV